MSSALRNLVLKSRRRRNILEELTNLSNAPNPKERKTMIESQENQFQGSATYSPEDNKLRLYIGRVPREEYLKLRSEGWVTLHKQREAGGGDFAAAWTPARRDTALRYAGIIDDEDMGPAERAADRAERFSGYRDKRTNEAAGHADQFDQGPQAHGFQSQARAERAAARHDRVADRAGDAWSKAEYWTRRTAGVIQHALYKSSPSVRMGRIKILESDLRRFEQSPSHYPNWLAHTKLRLAYENQMCEAAGGRAALVEMVPGGFIGSHQIIKVNKSAVTGQVVSVSVITKHTTWKKGNLVEVVGPVLLNIERFKADAYRAPTPQELEAFNVAKKAEKDARPKTVKPPLINPTDADAERLQALWNSEALKEREASYKRQGYSLPVTDWKPSTVLKITQLVYSHHSKGSYASAKTREIGHLGELRGTHYNAPPIKVLCELRTTSADGCTYGAKRVIVLTDKPQKPFPAAIWQALEPVKTELVAA